MSLDFARPIRWRIRWVGLHTCVGEIRNSYGISVGNLEVKVYFWDVSCGDNIKMGLYRKGGCGMKSCCSGQFLVTGLCEHWFNITETMDSLFIVTTGSFNRSVCHQPCRSVITASWTERWPGPCQSLSFRRDGLGTVPGQSIWQMELGQNFLQALHSITVPYSVIYLSQTLCNLSSWQRHWIKTYTHAHTRTVVKQWNNLHRVFLIPERCTLHTAVIGTGQALLGSPRIVQASLRPFQKHLLLWVLHRVSQCDTGSIPYEYSFLSLLWITLLDDHFSITTLYSSSIIISWLTDLSTDEVPCFKTVKCNYHCTDNSNFLQNMFLTSKTIIYKPSSAHTPKYNRHPTSSSNTTSVIYKQLII